MDKVTDTEIFTKYFGEFDFNTSYSSVFREDEDPSTGFYTDKNNRIIYNDLHPEGKNYGSIAFVMEKYNISFGKALDKIWKELVLNEEGEEIPISEKKVIPKKEKVHKEFSIIPHARFTEEDMKYWSQYGITEEELVKNEVYSVNRLFVNGKMASKNKDHPLKFAYRIKHEGKWYLKIYTPTAKKFKWVGTVPLTAPFGWDSLPHKSDTLLITKAQKDRIIWLKYFTDVIALQNESLAALDKSHVEYITKNYKRVIINFDADKAGKKACNDYNEAYGWECFSTPDKLWEEKKIKDCSDLVAEFGLEVFEKFLKKEGII